MSTNATPGAAPPRALKVVIAGGFGVGKTSIVGALSEVKPLRTEAKMTAASIGIDDTSKVDQKTTTTVAMDFGRITIDRSLIMYLFGTPGQDRFGFMWDDLVTGAIGAVVLVDLRRIDDCFDAVDYFENRSIPFVVAVNVFDADVTYPDAGGARCPVDLGPCADRVDRRPGPGVGQGRAAHAARRAGDPQADGRRPGLTDLVREPISDRACRLRPSHVRDRGVGGAAVPRP